MDPRGRFVVSGSRDRLAKVWSRATGELLHNLSGHTGDVTAVAIDPQARVAGSGGADRTVKVWSLDSGRLLHTLSGHTGTVRALTFDPEGRHLASGGDDGSVRIWALPSGQLRATLVATDAGEWGVLTPDGYVDGSHRGLGLTRFGPGGVRSRLLGLLRQAVPGLLGRVLRGEGDFRLQALERLLARERRP
jgi:WD40 repeat protein